MGEILSLLKQLNKKGSSPLITLVSIVLLSLTAYFTSTAATSAIEDSVNDLNRRVSANEQFVTIGKAANKESSDSIIVIETKLENMEKDLAEIKADIKFLVNSR